jgi:GLPGLI family protein
VENCKVLGPIIVNNTLITKKLLLQLNFSLIFQSKNKRYHMSIKWITTLVLLCAFTTLALSQNNEGMITYEEKINIWKNLPPEMEAMKDRIPEFRSSNHELLFTPKETMYKPKERTKEELEKQRERRAGQGRRGGWGRRGGRGSKSVVYSDLSAGVTKQSTEFFGKNFLVEGAPKSYKWKLTGKQRQIGEYLCQEATFQDSTTNVKAWFTPMIPVMTGPSNYTGLPGMILHMDFDEGTRTITATNIELAEMDATLFKEPTEGKKISKDEFEKIREEKMKEMKQEYGGRGGRFHRRG